MAAGRSIGTIFVDFDINFDPITRSQKRLKDEATSIGVGLEENFRRLGIKTGAEFDLMRQKVSNAFIMIANDARATSNEILRAEQAKNAQLDVINQQQFGKQVTLADGLKAHWIAVSAAIVGAWVAVGKAMQFIELGAQADQAAESFRLVAESSGFAADTLLANLDRAAAGTMDDSDIMQRAVKGIVLGLDDRQLVTIMENARIAARYAGTDVKTAFEDITNAIGTDMPRALRRYGLITREESRLIQKAISEGAEDIKLYDIAMAHAAVNTARFGQAQANAAESVQRFHAVINETRETIGKFAIGFAQYLAAGALGLDAFATRGVAALLKLMGKEEDYQMLLDAGNQMLLKRNAILGIQTDDEKRAAEEGKVAAGKALEDAEAALKKEQDRLRIAAGRAEAAKQMEKNQQEGIKSWVAFAEEQIRLNETMAQDELKANETLVKGRELAQQKEIEGWVAVAEEQIRLSEMIAQDEIRKTNESAQRTAALQQEEIRGWVAYAEERIRLNELEAKTELDRLEARQLEIKKLQDTFRDLFQGIGSAISTSIHGVIQGTQTMETAFKNMAQSIMLSLVDKIINKGLKAVEDAMVSFFTSIYQELASAAAGTLGQALVRGVIGGLGGAAGGAAGGASGGGGTAYVGAGYGGGYGGAQEGAIVTRPTLLWAGEKNEPEVIVPLKRIGEFISNVRGGGEDDWRKTPIVHQTINVSPGVPETVRREVWAMMPMIRREAVDAVLEARNRGGTMTKAMGERKK